MVVDTSALIAIMLEEPEARAFELKIASEPGPIIAHGNAVEFGTLMRKRFYQDLPEFAATYLASLGIEIWSASPGQATLAIEAGYRHRILNFGDTFAYALAKDLDLPLLFKGKDFSKTDIRPALES